MTLKNPEKLADAATSTLFSATLLPGRILALRGTGSFAIRSGVTSTGKALASGLGRLAGRGRLFGSRKTAAEEEAAAAAEPSTDQACVVCLSEPREVRLTACGHVVLCVTCVTELERRKARGRHFATQLPSFPSLVLQPSSLRPIKTQYALVTRICASF